ncbi:MAG TPA: 3-dehydroquinate synthase [Herpetosiphonaceae bacterium]
MQHKIALVGLSGSGKTTVGRLLAESLGWRYIDTDHLVEARAQQPIAQIIAQTGEAAFRHLESQALMEALKQQHVVIATGGGIVEDPANRERLRNTTFTVWLHAPTATLVSRLDGTTDRPLLADGPATRLAQMAERRAPLYAAIADWTIVTVGLTPAQVVDEILHGRSLRSAAEQSDGLQVTTPGGTYSVRAGHHLLAELPGWLERLGLRGRVWLVSDTTVFPLHGGRVCELLRSRNHVVGVHAIPAGEQYKTLDTVRQVYDWLLAQSVERGDVLLALGGGVVGDLAGFVAATVLRGIAVVQLPTTVLAMVDSAIGGKTGVDHAVGKNLIGAFHQPRLVLADTSVLPTLPTAERAAGWAEAIKHGIIGDPQLFSQLKQHAQAVLDLEEPITGALIQRAAAHKVRVVSGDEREHGGRITLNYGHTIGHAVEAESGYTLRHGEAIAVGMMAAGTIAARLGIFDPAALDEQRIVLEAFGLPTRLPTTIDPGCVLQRLGSDKKVRSSRVRWVLPTRIGATVVRDDVPIELVAEVLDGLRETTD